MNTFNPHKLKYFFLLSLLTPMMQVLYFFIFANELLPNVVCQEAPVCIVLNSFNQNSFFWLLITLPLSAISNMAYVYNNFTFRWHWN